MTVSKSCIPVVVRRNKRRPPTISNQLAYTSLRPSATTSRTPSAAVIGKWVLHLDILYCRCARHRGSTSSGRLHFTRWSLCGSWLWNLLYITLLAPRILRWILEFLGGRGWRICASLFYWLDQCFSTAGPRPGTGPWHQLYQAARGSPGICHFSFLNNFHE